jgi:hypothetical protein
MSNSGATHVDARLQDSFSDLDQLSDRDDVAEKSHQSSTPCITDTIAIGEECAF